MALWHWGCGLWCWRARGGAARPHPMEHEAQPHKSDQHQLGEKEIRDHGKTPSYRWRNEGILPGFQTVGISRKLEVHGRTHARSRDRTLHQSVRVWTAHLRGNQHLCYTFELVTALGWSDRLRGGITDSQLILAAYEKWGTSCPAQLLGNFAFAIWDRLQQDRKRRVADAKLRPELDFRSSLSIPF
jgi:hypothetical protein